MVILPSHQRQTRDRAVEVGANGQPWSSHTVTGEDAHADDDSGLDSSVPPHPLGIKPLGNKYFATDDARTRLGVLQALPDEMLMQLLEYLDLPALRLLGYTCKFLFACCASDDIFKSIFLE